MYVNTFECMYVKVINTFKYMHVSIYVYMSKLLLLELYEVEGKVILNAIYILSYAHI
jgi:hypothetical protein